MKAYNRILFSLLLITTLFPGCKKSSSPLGSMPDHFVKRALLEENTAEWCCECPPGGDMINSLKTTQGDKLVAVSIHDGDFLDMSGIYDPIATALGEPVQQYPTGTIDRSTSSDGLFWDYYSYWGQDIQSELTKDNNTGIAMITSIKGNTATIEVHVGYHTTNNYDMRLNVFLIENNIPQQTQCAGPSGPPDPGYIHQQVLRQIATPALGDPISMRAGNWSNPLLIGSGFYKLV